MPKKEKAPKKGKESAEAAAAPGVSAEAATKCVLEVLAAKSGFEVDMIEMDMALDDLGVDPTEIVSDVQRELGVEAQDGAALSTVGEIVDAIKNAGAGSGEDDQYKGLKVGLVSAVEDIAEKLKACTIDIGAGNEVTIVTNASNVAENSRVIVATVGAQLNDDSIVQKKNVGGRTSQGHE